MSPPASRFSGAPGLRLPAGAGRRFALLALAPFFVLAGLNHFWNPGFYIWMMPSWLPAHRALVALSGVAEILGGLGVLVPASRQLAGWGLVALLLAVFPANLNMALHAADYPEIAPWVLVARLPFQLVFIAWAWWGTRPGPSARSQ